MNTFVDKKKIKKNMMFVFSVNIFLKKNCTKHIKCPNNMHGSFIHPPLSLLKIKVKSNYNLVPEA